MTAFNVSLSTFVIDNVGPISSSSSILSTDSLKDIQLDTKVSTIGTVGSATANALSITGSSLQAHISDGVLPGVIRGSSLTNIVLGAGSLGNVIGTGNIAIGSNIGNTIVTGNNNILLNGAVDSGAATNRIVLGADTSSIDNSLLISTSITSWESTLSAIDTDSFLIHDGTEIAVSSAALMRRTGGTMSGILNMNNNFIDNMGIGVLDSDLIRKQEADLSLGGLDPKESCTYVTLSNIVDFSVKLGVEAALDLVSGVAPVLVVGDRVLVRSQTDDKLNGIYWWNVAGTALERAPDQDGTPASEVSSGNFTFVENGDTLGVTGWVLQGDGLLTLGVDSLVWSQFSASTLIGGVNVGGGLGLFKQKTGNTLEYKSIVAGVGSVIVENTNDITISSDVTLISAGGTSIVSGGSGGTFTLKGLTAGTNMSITSDAITVTLSLVTSGVTGTYSIFDKRSNGVGLIFQQFLSDKRTIMSFDSIIRNDIGIGLVSNVFTFPAGIYFIRMVASVDRDNVNDSTIALNIMDSANTVLMDGPFTDYGFSPTMQGVLNLGSITNLTVGMMLAGSTEVENAHMTFNAENTILKDVAVNTILLTALTFWDTVQASTFFNLEYSKDNRYISFIYVWNSNIYLAIIDTVTMTESAAVLVVAGTTGGSCVWGFNNTSNLYVATTNLLTAYSWDGVTLSLVTTVATNYNQDGIDIREVVDTIDVIVVGGTTMHMISFNGAVFTSITNVIADNRIVAFNANGDRVVTVDSTASIVRVYSWNGSALTLLGTGVDRVNAGVPCAIMMDPLDTHVFVAYSVNAASKGYDAYTWNGTVLGVAPGTTTALILDQAFRNVKGAAFDYTDLMAYVYNFGSVGGTDARLSMYSYDIDKDTLGKGTLGTNTEKTFVSGSSNSSVVGTSRNATQFAYTVYNSLDSTNARIVHSVNKYGVPMNEAVSASLWVEKL